AYQFLMRTYEPEDRIYVFGFSRGAYTARALCGMLHVVGLLSSGNEALIPYAIRMLKRRSIDFAVLADFKKTFSRECKVHFIGVWDTVSSVGWITTLYSIRLLQRIRPSILPGTPSQLTSAGPFIVKIFLWKPLQVKISNKCGSPVSILMLVVAIPRQKVGFQSSHFSGCCARGNPRAC